MACHIDCIGIENTIIEAELLDMFKILFEQLNLEIDILVNNRKILNQILKQADVIDTEQQRLAIIAIDKFDKIGAEGVSEELAKNNLNDQQISAILKLISLKGKDNVETLNNLKQVLEDTTGIEEFSGK